MASPWIWALRLAFGEEGCCCLCCGPEVWRTAGVVRSKLDGSLRASGLVGTRAGRGTVWARRSRTASRGCASSLDDSLEVICARAPCRDPGDGRWLASPMSGQAQALRLTQGTTGEQGYDCRRLGRSLWWRPGSENGRSQVGCRGWYSEMEEVVVRGTGGSE